MDRYHFSTFTLIIYPSVHQNNSSIETKMNKHQFVYFLKTVPSNHILMNVFIRGILITGSKDFNFYEYICLDGLIFIYSKNNHFLMNIACVNNIKIQGTMYGLEI